MRAPIAALPIISCALAGCASPPGGFDSPEPAARLHAVAEAARTEDHAAVPHLIELLDSDDPAVRLLSIRTLEKLTGQTLGYDHAAPEPERRAATDRWARWYNDRAAPSPDVDPVSDTPAPGYAAEARAR